MLPNFLAFTLSGIFASVLLSFCYVVYKMVWLQRQAAGSERMVEIAQRLADGAKAFLREEYRSIAWVAVGVVLLLGGMSLFSAHAHPARMGTFLLGAGASAVAGLVGMHVATLANVRTAEGAKDSLAAAFAVAFAGGAVMGVGVVALALVGVAALFAVGYWWFVAGVGDYRFMPQVEKVLGTLTGFALGAETIALFARVGGGIYTKAADVGSDIVGKVEAGIPEDDPRNPATIADNVGDNVGDVAGMGADLFGSYVSTILAAMVLGCRVEAVGGGLMLVLLPLVVGAIGLFASLLAVQVVRVKNEDDNIHRKLAVGNLLAIGLTAVGAFAAVCGLLPTELFYKGAAFSSYRLFGAVGVGLVVGVVVGMVTEYFTTMGRRPVDFIIRQSATGPATNVIAGLSVGMLSTLVPMVLFALGICAAFYLASFYGVAMAAVGMMSTTAIQLAMDAFGPIADNAGGIAEMGALPAVVRRRTDLLDMVGNTTAATGKGFAIASAALTSLGLFVAFAGDAHVCAIDILEAPSLAGLFCGAMLPFLFSAWTIKAVGAAAMDMVQEVRRQFREIPGLLTGEGTPAYDRCIAIATRGALREMVLPGVVTIASPVLVGVLCGAEVLAAFLAGVMVVGAAMALFQCNAGGAWDNAKKAFEQGVVVDGAPLEKGSEAYKAAVVGDTVGDPLKDTSGPSMNILIKLTTLVALIIAPHLSAF